MIKFPFHIFIVIFLGVILTSCGINRELYEEVGRTMSNDTSSISIVAAIHSSKTALSKRINQIFPDTLASGVYEDYGGIDYSVFKGGNMDIEAHDRTINSKIPLRIIVEKDLGFSKAKGEGLISLELVSNVSISPEWDLQAHTELKNYEWIEEPKLALGPIKIPAASIADYLIKNMQDELQTQLDTQINESLNLPEKIASLQSQLVGQLQFEYEGQWFNVVPKKLGVSGLYTIDEDIHVQLAVAGNLFVEDQFRKANTYDTLKYTRIDFEKDRDLSTTTVRLSETDLKDVIKAYLDQNPIEIDDQREVKLKNTRFSITQGVVEVASEAEGYLNGPILIQARAKYNKERNEVELSNFNFKANIKGFFKRLGLNVAKGRIKKEVENALNDFIYDYLNEYNNMAKTWHDDRPSDLPIGWNSEALQVELSDITFGAHDMVLIFETKGALKIDY